jgi:hypothetical protein
VGVPEPLTARLQSIDSGFRNFPKGHCLPPLPCPRLLNFGHVPYPQCLSEEFLNHMNHL